MRINLGIVVQVITGSVLSEIYFWKPQNAMVSALFQLIISYVLGNAVSSQVYLFVFGLIEIMHRCITPCLRLGFGATLTLGHSTSKSTLALPSWRPLRQQQPQLSVL